jgi:D-3-phosphoglycerate dehydrogenase
VAKCAKEMGMVVLGYDPVMTQEAFKEAGLQRAELDEIYRSSDFITVHTPLTPETNNLLNEKTMMQCKRGKIVSRL